MSPAPRKPKRSATASDYLIGEIVSVTRDDGSAEMRSVKYAPWQLGDGTWVIGLDGIAGGYLLSRVAKPRRKP